MISIILLLVNIMNKANTNMIIPKIARDPPIKVKSVFVVQAYKVKEKNTAIVKNAAINTILGLEKPQIKETM